MVVAHCDPKTFLESTSHVLFAANPEAGALSLTTTFLMLVGYIALLIVLGFGRLKQMFPLRGTLAVLLMVFICLAIINALSGTETPRDLWARWMTIATLWLGAAFIGSYVFCARSPGRIETKSSILIEPEPPVEIKCSETSRMAQTQPIGERIAHALPALCDRAAASQPAAHRFGEDLFRLLFDGNPHPLWVFDEKTLGFLAVNDAVIQKYGYTLDEFMGMTIRDVLHGDDVAQIIQCIAGSLDGDNVISWRHRTKAGVLIEIEVVTSRLPFTDRSIRQVVAADVVDRRRAEGALREHEQLFRNVIANIPCGVFWKDRASVYQGCNDQVARDLGLVRGEVVGQTDYELAVNSEEAESSRKCDRDVIDSRAPLLNIEETCTRKDGRKSALLVSRVPLRDSSGDVVGVLGVYQDVTDRKRLEDQLRQAQKMEAIGRLAGGIAHDFNNLLTIIIGNAHILKQLPADAADLPQLVDDIHDAADRAAALTRQLLTFSRRQPSRPEIVDLNEVVAGLAGLLRRLLGEQISVRTQAAQDPVRVRADRGHLEQVVMNLAVNARDAMPGGGTLSISTSTVTAPGAPGSSPTRFVRLTISDTGVGMTEEVKARIFEPFFTTKEPGKGTGLGLATVYGIIEQAGGHIEVESAPGAGTTFRIGLPWCNSVPRPSSIITGRNSILAGAAGQGKSVLLAEDEEGIRKLARFALEARGYQVVEAEDGASALPLVRADQPIDLLITDLVMPGLDGRDLATRVREVHPGIGIVFISGYVPDAHRLEGLAGALFLPKPFNPGDLVKMAERAIRRKASAKETMSSNTATDCTACGN